jgi:ketosteroid isomerase-like protein
VARNDFDAVLATKTDDVVLPPVVGHGVVRRMYSGLVGKFRVGNTATSADFIVDVAGDVAVVFRKAVCENGAAGRRSLRYHGEIGNPGRTYSCGRSVQELV